LVFESKKEELVPFFSVVIVTGRHNKLEESSWMRIQSMRHRDVPSLTVQFVLPVTMTLFTEKGCGESRVVHGHRVAQHPLVAAGDSGNHL
jgi:hypothetical protein